MLLYIAGPMSGIEGFNFAAFDDAERLLHESGIGVCNPARIIRESFGFDPERYTDAVVIRDFLKLQWPENITQLCVCNGVALLSGWQSSLGVHAELIIAGQIGIEAKGVDEWISLATENTK